MEGDALSMFFHDYDWADEVLHVHIGRRVLAQAFATTGERDQAAARAQAGYERIVAEDRALERSDWSDEFYSAFTGGRGG